MLHARMPGRRRRGTPACHGTVAMARQRAGAPGSVSQAAAARADAGAADVSRLRVRGPTPLVRLRMAGQRVARMRRITVAMRPAPGPPAASPVAATGEARTASGADKVSDRAKAKAQAGDLVGAMTLFRRATELAPGVANHRSNCGAMLVHLGRREEARACFEEALGLDPGNARIRAQADKYGFTEKL